MEPLWIALSVGILVIIALSLFGVRKKTGRNSSFSWLMTLATVLVVMGIIFGDNRIVGYSFIGAGVVLAVADAIRRRKGSRPL